MVFMFNKAQIEISFNWVFVLVAGAAILVLFYNVISFETDATSDQLGRTVMERMSIVLSSYESSVDSVRISTTPFNRLLIFSCGIDGHRFSLENSVGSVHLEQDLLFSPPRVGESRLISWSTVLNVPYPVGRVTFLVDNMTHYNFSNDAKYYFDLFPGEISKSLNYVPPGFRDVINIDVTGDDLVVNGVEYEGIDIDVLKMGFIITGDEDLFNCTMDKIQERTRAINKVYYNRTYELNESVSITFYHQVLPIFEEEEIPSPANRNELASVNDLLRNRNLPRIY